MNIVRVLLALAIAALVQQVSAADQPLVWKRWGVEPYAASFAEACRKAPKAIEGFAFPQEVKEHFRKVLGTECGGGAEVWLVPHQKLEAMWTGGTKPHVMKSITVGELPVLKSPDGRTYRKGAVAETAKALSWAFVYEGKSYVLYLPFECFNWSWALGPSPVQVALPPVEQCATVAYTVKPGDEVRFAVFAQKRLRASSCWRLCDGAECSAPPSPCDTCDWAGPKSVIPTTYESQHSGWYVAREAKQTLRFPVDVQQQYVALCVEREGLGQSDSWIVQPSAWVGNNGVVLIPYGGQTWPAWGQVDMSKWRSRP